MATVVQLPDLNNGISIALRQHLSHLAYVSLSCVDVYSVLYCICTVAMWVVSQSNVSLANAVCYLAR